MTQIDEKADPHEIVDLINKASAVKGGPEFKLTEHDLDQGLNLRASFGEREARIEIRTLTEGNRELNSVKVVDIESDEILGFGNPETDLDTAISTYHWNQIN